MKPLGSAFDDGDGDVALTERRKQPGHRDRRGGVRAGHLQARRLDRELVLDDRLAPLRRDSGLLEDRRLESGRL